MKFFIYSPYHRTGGPESLHQYCDMMNLLGHDAYMYYWNIRAPPDQPLSAVSIHPDAPPLYTEKYAHLKRAVIVEDSEKNTMIIPEIISIEKIRKSFPKIRVAVAWLSMASGLPLLNEYLSDPKLIHLFQSHWAKTHVTDAATGAIISYNMDDYIPDEYTMQTWNPEQKEDIVAYNPAKDSDTPAICLELGVKCIPIQNMDTLGVMNTLKRCKVYVDLGHHPGRDRMPREAALVGCVVVTNLKGTAAFYEDVMIETRSNERNCQLEFIKRAITDYPTMISKQDNYVSFILDQKKKLAGQMHAFISTTSGHSQVTI